MRTTALENRPIAPIASALILQDTHTTGPFAVEELTPSEITLQGLNLETLRLGKAMVVLSTPGRELLRLWGVVTHKKWLEGACASVSLRLVDLNPDLEDQIQDIVTQHLERGSMPMTLVLDRGRLEAFQISRFLHSLGRNVVFARNSLEALWALETFRDAYSTVLIDHSFIQANGPEILLFLHDEYRDKRRVLVVPKFHTTHDDLSAMVWSVHGVLTTPWTTEHLESALGLLPPHRTGQSKRILFVDDEASVLSGLQHRLHKYLSAHETVWVTSGEVALAEAKARAFDVVVTDLRMPGMDGLTLLRQIKSEAPQSKRVVLSGCDLHAAKDVADIVLSKPCPLDLLRMEVLGPG
jgi:CheY-like chemotaxis protein